MVLTPWPFVFSIPTCRPEHERQVLERARQVLPHVFISASYQVLPEFREYERLSTTVTNAFLGPTMAGYIAAFRSTCANSGCQWCRISISRMAAL